MCGCGGVDDVRFELVDVVVVDGYDAVVWFVVGDVVELLFDVVDVDALWVDVCDVDVDW